MISVIDVLRRNRPYVKAGTLIYAVGFGIGAVLGLSLGTIDPAVVPEQFAASGESPSDVSLLYILRVNTLNITAMALGAVFFGTLTVLLCLKNGFAHGVIIGTSLVGSGSPMLVALLFLPHAVIELPAIWVATASGFTIPSRFVEYLREKHDTPVRRTDVLDTVGLFLVAEVLTVVAALVEFYVSSSFA